MDDGGGAEDKMDGAGRKWIFRIGEEKGMKWEENSIVNSKFYLVCPYLLNEFSCSVQEMEEWEDEEKVEKACVVGRVGQRRARRRKVAGEEEEAIILISYFTKKHAAAPLGLV